MNLKNHNSWKQYKELDGLMAYILDEMWGVDDKELIREGIIAYANKWEEVQSKDKPDDNEFIPDVDTGTVWTRGEINVEDRKQKIKDHYKENLP